MTAVAECTYLVRTWQRERRRKQLLSSLLTPYPGAFALFRFMVWFPASEQLSLGILDNFADLVRQIQTCAF